MTAQRKIYLITISFLVIFTLAIIFGISPLLTEIKKSSENLIFQKRALALFQKQLVDLEDFQENYSLYQPTLERVEKSFIDPEVPLLFIEFLEREAQKANLEIEISPLTLAQAKTDLWQSGGLGIFLGGTLPNCLRFLERLERSSYLVEISQLNIERTLGEVSLNIGLKTFSGQPPPEEKK